MMFSNNRVKFIAFVLAFITAALTLCGCNDSTVRVKSKPAASRDLTTTEGLARSLKNIPTVEKIAPWSSEYGQGITITTAHYNIHTTMLEPLTLQRVPGFMESAYRAYQQQLPVPIETQNKFTVYLFGSRGQWERFTKKFAGKNADVYLKIQKGAYYLNGACVTYNIGRAKTFSVLAHEGWHQFNSRHFAYRLPSWLDEGLATQFENSNYKNGFYYFDPSRNGSRLGSLRRTLEENKAITIEKLLTLNPGEVVAHADLSAVMGFYAQSYALVRFLKEDDYGRNLMKFQKMLLDARTGDWPLDDKLKRMASDRNCPLTSGWNRYISPKLFSYYIADQNVMQDRYHQFCIKIARIVKTNRTMEITHK